MKFGKVDRPELIDFTLPPDHPDTHPLLIKASNNSSLDVRVGLPKWTLPTTSLTKVCCRF